MTIQTVILAAGQGKRMHSNVPKVLHTLAGKPLLEYVIDTALTVSPDLSPIIVHGHQSELVRHAFTHYPIQWVEQKEQQGTGHALLQTLPQLASAATHVLILYGDVPLISTTTLQRLIDTTPTAALGILTATLNTPEGYGRIKRDAQNRIMSIVEEKDADEKDRLIKEINTGIYYVPIQQLKRWLPLLNNQNQQKEYYLTDIILQAVAEEMPIHAIQPDMREEISGVNDRSQLASLERFYQSQRIMHFMQQGVTFYDPARVDIRGEVSFGRDVTVDINVIFEGQVKIGKGCVIGPNTIIRNTILGEHVEIKANSVIDGAEIAAHVIVGPFARLRPGTIIAAHAHVGNFVEIKNSVIGEKTKINHLSYVGDSELGRSVNIGAGTITCNYDGFNKHKTIIGDHVQVGSDTTLIAPLVIEENAYIATATTVRKNVPAGALVFNTRDQQVREGWREAYDKKQEKKCVK